MGKRVAEAEVVAVYARSSDKAKAFAGKHNIPQWYGDLNEAIKNSLPGKIVNL